MTIKDHPEEEHFSRMKDLCKGMKFNKIVDLGCGDGFLASTFLDCTTSIIGIDKNEGQINDAKKRFFHHKNITFECQDLELVSLIKENLLSCDLVIMCEMVYYLTHKTQKRIIKEVHKILVPGGHLLTSKHAAESLEDEFSDYKNLFERIKYERFGIWNLSLLRKKK